MRNALVAGVVLAAALVTAVSSSAQQLRPHNLVPYFQILATAANVQPGGIIFRATEAQTVAPGQGNAVLYFVPGTNAGTCKLVAIAGTSFTPVTIADNIGAGGCQ